MIIEKSKQIPLVWEGDLCVLGGSCTGVFAAIRAARLGLKVAIVEKQNRFGGTATCALTCAWHSMYDFDFKERIVSGLSEYVIETLKSQGQAETNEVPQYRNIPNPYNPVAMVHLLDEMVLNEKNIHTYFHTFYAGVEAEDGEVKYVFIQNKDGRGAIKAKFYIDATGDGDVMRDLGCERYYHKHLQPPTSCFFMHGNTSDEVVSWAVKEHGAEFGLDDDWGWFASVVGLNETSMRADNHVFGYDLSIADELTKAEFEGRRRAFAFEALMKRYVSKDFGIVNLSSAIGIRETAHYKTRYMATENDLLMGTRFDDAILQGTYRVDIHHDEDNGISFKELNGDLRIEYGKGSRQVVRNWRKDMGLDDNYSRFYQVPFSILVQDDWKNIIPAGRMVNADDAAFGALRVMINTNQLGEAAGVAAFHCLDSNCSVQDADGVKVRELLVKGGSAL